MDHGEENRQDLQLAAQDTDKVRRALLRRPGAGGAVSAAVVAHAVGEPVDYDGVSLDSPRENRLERTIGEAADQPRSVAAEGVYAASLNRKVS